jgi:hypothetical protein
MNIIWVLVTFSLTIVDSFMDFDAFYTLPGDAGYSILAVWTSLLPLVVSWLLVGSQPGANHLHDTLNEAHDVAYMATASELVLTTQISGRSTRAIKPLTKHVNYTNDDEKETTPMFNYA